MSVEQLPREDRCLFALLDLVRSEEFKVEVAAALLDRTADEAADALERLVDAGLLGARAGGIYVFHDLIGLFADELSRELPTAEAAEATKRTASWFTDTATSVGEAEAQGQPAGTAVEVAVWLEQHGGAMANLAHRLVALGKQKPS